MQAFSSTGWIPPRGTLGELVDSAMERATVSSRQFERIREEALATPPPPGFASALRGPHVSLIAEVKRASPSKGAIAPALDAVEQARRFHEAGAAAISVLTEPSRFAGSLDDLKAVSRSVPLPTLRKDFIVHPVQIWEARAAGAAAILLIVRALSHDALSELAAVASEARVDVLFEVRDEDELARALAEHAAVIGVNNRNLETLVIDAGTAPRIIPLIPPHAIAIAESGMSAPADAVPAIAAGADALLVGSALSAAADPKQAARTFASFARVAR